MHVELYTDQCSCNIKICDQYTGDVRLAFLSEICMLVNTIDYQICIIILFGRSKMFLNKTSILFVVNQALVIISVFIF